MNTATMPQLWATDDELTVLAVHAGVEDFPTALILRPRPRIIPMLDCTFDLVTRRLVARGLIVDGLVAPDVAALVVALHGPDRELAMRFVTPQGNRRVSVVRQGSLIAFARRIDDDVALRAIGYDGELQTVTKALLRELPRAEPARVEPVGAPLQAMAECLDQADDGPWLADRIRALGAEPRAAMLLDSARASCVAFAEITYHPLARDEDRISRCPAAVAVFYTERGRIVAVPAAAPSGELWITLKPGSDHMISKAIGQLIDLSSERWEDE